MCENRPVRLDDSHVAILVGCKHTIDRKESTVRQFDDSRAAVLDDMVVGNDAAIFAYEETAALGDRMAILVGHDYGDNRPIRFSDIAGISRWRPLLELGAFCADIAATSNRTAAMYFMNEVPSHRGRRPAFSPIEFIRESRTDQLTEVIFGLLPRT